MKYSYFESNTKACFFTFFLMMFLLSLPSAQGQMSEHRNCLNLDLTAELSPYKERDTFLYNIYLNIYEETKDICLDTALVYLKNAAALAEEIHHGEGVKFANYRLATIHFDLDSLDMATRYAEKSLQHSTLSSRPYYRALLLLAEINRYRYAYLKGAEQLKKAEALAAKAKDTTALIAVYSALTVNYRLQNDYNQSIAYNLKGLELAKKQNDSMTVVQLHQNIAVIYYNLPNYEKALEHIKMGEDYLNPELDIEKLYLLQTKAITYNEMGEEKKALDLNLQVLEEAERQNNRTLHTLTCINIASSYFKLKQIDKVEKYLGAVNVEESTNSQLFDYHLMRCQMYIARKNYKAAEKSLATARGFFNYEHDYYSKSEFYFQKSIVAATLGEMDSVYAFQTKGFDYLDSFYVNSNQDEVAQIEQSYKNKIAQDSIQILNLINEKQNVKIRNRSLIAALSVALLCGLFLLTWYYRSASIKQKKINQILEKSRKDKERLLSNIAHEFQTPLSLIKGLTSQIKGTTAQENSRLEVIARNSEYLIGATNHILMANKNKQEDLPQEFHYFSLQAFLNFMIFDFRFLAGQKGVYLEVNPDNNPDIIVYSELTRLKVILNNLLTNALKYTDRGGVVKLNYRNEGSDKVVLEIEDSGKGICKEDLENLFERYFQANIEKPEGGFGIGLAICKEYTESLKGSISVTSKPGEGSKFTLKLPLKRETKNLEITDDLFQFPTLTDRETAIEKGRNDKASKGFILIAEDNPDYRKYLSGIFEEEYKLEIVEDGTEALVALEKGRPDLIISDWMMSEMNGVELVQHLRKSDKYRHIPVLMLTARSLVSDQIKALRAGIDYYLEKTADIRLLKNTVEDLILRTAERKDKNPVFAEAQDFETILSVKDQEWLMQAEKIMVPLLGDLNLTLDQIAEQLKISTKQLNRKIKLTTGFTAKKYIQELRFWEARRMLELKEYDSVKAVCISVGFKSQQNFSRNFKERFGKNPSEYL